MLTDGLYMVSTSYFVAGFVVHLGKITQCAPILRNKLGYWKTVAQRIGD